MTRRRERPILAFGITVAAVVLIATSGLVVYALAGVARTDTERHRQLAERMFDELEGELTTLVSREEARSFLEYRYFYVPPATTNPNLVQSELSRLPTDPWLVGWFQVDPNGTVTTPSVPRDNESDIALSNGWVEDPLASTALGQLRSIVARVAWADRPSPTPAMEQAQSSMWMNREVLKRSQRKLQVVASKGSQLSSYGAQNVDPWSPTRGDPDVSVEVTPFSGVRVDRHLVLWRTVTAGGERHRQGVVLQVDALGAHLEQVVLGTSELRPFVRLAWNGDPIDPRAYRFDHRFADPFGAMSVVATFERVPDLAGAESLTVPLLAGVVVLAVLGGGFALFVAIRAELAYARRRNDFVAAVSHELKTPLTTIRMYAEMLRDGMVPQTDRQRAYHHTITLESDRLGRLIDNVLELARLERGGGTPAVVVGAIEPALREAVEIVGPHASASGFEIEVAVDPDLPPVRIDRDALTQIVVNLVDNSVKFAGSGSRRIELHAGRHGDGVRLVVRDHGPGVPRGQVRKVFEPFWRGESELTRNTRGTGIGLALVRGLAQRMGGQVAARNHPDGGFEVELTLAG